jgi:hypothetical protein
MFARLLITFFFSLSFAACDLRGLDGQAGTTPLALGESWKPSGLTITCCRCTSSGCKYLEVNGAVCPPGWEPAGPPKHPK